MRFHAALVAAFVAVGCTDKPKTTPSAALPKAAPLEPLVVARSDAGDADATFTVRPFTFVGPAAPATALRLDVVGETATPSAPGSAVVLAFDEDTYLAQVLPLLAALNDGGAQVWLQSPDAPAIAWPVTLRDEATFNAWLDEPTAGKLRVIQRSDGFELQTNMGKLPGADVKGPTVPARGGTMDLVLLQEGLTRVKGRFTEAPDVCFMPSYGTTMRDATRAIATNWSAADKRVFGAACLVYPRPKK